MSYVRRVLQPEEIVVYATRLHWIVYLRALLLLIICIALAGAAWYTADNPNLNLSLLIAAAIFALLALSSAFPAFVRRITTELAGPDTRFINNNGPVSPQTIEKNASPGERVGG